MLFALLTLALGATPTTSAPGRAAPQRPLVIRAAQVHLGDGRSIADGIVLIEGGLIRAVGAGVEIPEGADVIEHPGHASAGLIGLHAASGATGALLDAARPVLAEASGADAFDPEHVELADALQAGVTSLVLTPSAQALSGGTSSVVKTAGGRVVEREAQLVLGFSDAALSHNRFPTSYSGALAELEQLFTEPRGPFALAASGELPVLLETRSRADVQRAVEFARRHELVGALVGAAWAGELAREIAPSGLTVVCGPFGIGEERRAIRAAVALAEADVPIAFAFDAPIRHAAGLRLTAVQCVRAGLGEAQAWKGLCTNAATAARVGDRIGRLERGFEADVVLWSGPPLDLASRAQAVYVDGARVWMEER